MNTKDIIMGKNMELLLADMLVKNQELEENLLSLTSKYEKLEEKYNKKSDQFEDLSQRARSESEKNKEITSNLMRIEKSLDVKTIDNKRLSENVQKYRDELDMLRKNLPPDLSHSVEKLKDENGKLKFESSEIKSKLDSYQAQDHNYQSIIAAANVALWEYKEFTNTVKFSEPFRAMVQDDRLPLVWDLDLISARIHEDDFPIFQNLFSNAKTLTDSTETTSIRFLSKSVGYINLDFHVVPRSSKNDIDLSGCITTQSQNKEAHKKSQDEIDSYLETIKIKDEKINQLKEDLKSAQLSATDINKIGQLGRELDELKKDIEQRDALLQNANEEREVAEDILREKEEEIKNLKEQLDSKDSNSEEYLQLEKELSTFKKEYANLSLIASKTDNAIIITDKNGSIEYVNEGFEKLTEYTASEVMGKKPGDFLQGDKTDSSHITKIREGLASGEPFVQ
ncbi:MAG: PAS domain-containing protein, partial [Bacteroidota bacterium]